MNKMAYKITVGLGDNLVIRIFFDAIKHKYDEIKIAHNKDVMRIYRNNDPTYWGFLNELGPLLFSEPPYVFDHNNYPENH